jgi:hypothetical protein
MGGGNCPAPWPPHGRIPPTGTTTTGAATGAGLRTGIDTPHPGSPICTPTVQRISAAAAVRGIIAASSTARHINQKAAIQRRCARRAVARRALRLG